MPAFKKISYWVFALFLLYLIFELIRKIFGGSLGFDELVVGLLVANTGYIFALHKTINTKFTVLSDKISDLHTKFAEHLGWHKGKENNP